jgi:hypothetical protein
MSKKTKEPSERGEPQWEHQVTEPPLVTRSISNKERGEPFERTPNLEGASPIAIAHLKMEFPCTCCNTINIFNLYNACKTERERPLVPFEREGALVPFAFQIMLAHQWEKPVHLLV